MSMITTRSVRRRARRSAGATATAPLVLGAVAATATSASAAPVATSSVQPPSESQVVQHMFSLEIHGQAAENISSVAALYPNHIILIRGSEHSALFDDWINAAINNGPNATRNFAITMYDGNNQQIKRYEFTDASIYKVADKSISIIFNKMEII
ncbi:hypothetical protein AB0D04_31405 [Streptomyces sp. NPDC048483]|uniref:hypothetical protein n=1 Tax=Streptomyces sp. NPDC048483 TaxID=3154927 RepID=UPI00342A4FCD